MQDLLIYTEDSVIVQYQNKMYQDTNENFLKDYGQKVPYKDIDYNKATEQCWLDGKAFQDYPNETAEDILASIDYLLQNQDTRNNIPPTLDELKDAKKAELKAQRDALEVSPLNNFDVDLVSLDRIDIANKVLLNGAVNFLNWTMSDNTIMSVSAKDFADLYNALAYRSNQLHEAYRLAKNKLVECTTAEEVAAVTLL